MKTFKEYAMTRGFAIGGVDSAHPIASLGDDHQKVKVVGHTEQLV